MTPARTIWRDILTEAVNLPASYPSRDMVLYTLEQAQRAATEKVPAVFSPQWYEAAIEALQDVPTRRWVLAQMLEAYDKARKEVFAICNGAIH